MFARFFYHFVVALTLSFIAGATLTAHQLGAEEFNPGLPECIAPANVGGGWDFTCRQFGKALYETSNIRVPMVVTNVAGGSGGVAFAKVVVTLNNDDDLIVAASTVTAVRLGQKGYVNMNEDMVNWIGAIGADYGIIAVAYDSPYKSLRDFIADLVKAPSRLTIAGGSSMGSWDHLKILMLAKKAGINDITKIKYIPFQGGGEAITSVLGKHVVAFSGDISEARGFIEANKIRVLAVLAEQRLTGEFDYIPTAREQGFDVIGANWRGFYAPAKVSRASYDYWVKAVKNTYKSQQWQKIMRQSGLMPFVKSGDDFKAFVGEQIKAMEQLSREIGLIE